MAAHLTVPDEAIERLRPLFSQVEGSCEVWTDAEIVVRMLIRGVMAYGQTAGRDFTDVAALAGELREAVDVG